MEIKFIILEIITIIKFHDDKLLYVILLFQVEYNIHFIYDLLVLNQNYDYEGDEVILH